MPGFAVRRWLYLALVLSTTALAAIRLWIVLRVDGLDALEVLILCLFVVLFGWISASFWISAFGAYAIRRGYALTPHPAARQSAVMRAPPPRRSSSRTAIVMPVYNEDPARIFSGLRAIVESCLERHDAAFDFYILSDSTDPGHWIAEELGWHDLSRALGRNVRLFYRHRPRNKGRKSGNIQDFCENWGALYDYMVVLDADSLMTGDTLAALVHMMDACPRTALIQVPPQLVGRDSLFARMQQFASSAYGPVVAAGLSWLQGSDGNYWGHNAIIRIRPFMQCCGLPALPGAPPFGGEIMSHDFVEAALLRRAGWEVWMAPRLGGSFEEPPPTLADYLKRDRRWCQGNLQHIRLLPVLGFRLPSRLHIAMGIMSYLSSPLWLLLLLASAVEMYRVDTIPEVRYFGRMPVLSLNASHALELEVLAGFTLALLYGPKLLGFFFLARDGKARRAHGGLAAALASMATESVLSALFAAITMLSHSWFIASMVLGRSAGWGSQQRDDGCLSPGEALRFFLPHMLIGGAAAAALWHYIPESIGWFTPLLAGALLAVPLAYGSGAIALGEAARRAGLLLVPSETEGLPILQRARALRDSYAAPRGADSPAQATRLPLHDPFVRQLHLALLRDAARPPHQAAAPFRLLAAARNGDTAGFSREDWMSLLSDPQSLHALPEAAEMA